MFLFNSEVLQSHKHRCKQSISIFTPQLEMTSNKYSPSSQQRRTIKTLFTGSI